MKDDKSPSVEPYFHTNRKIKPIITILRYLLAIFTYLVSTYFGHPNLRIYFVLIYKICTYYEKICTFILIFSETMKFCRNVR